MSPALVVLAAVVVALALLVALVRRHVPEGGLPSWVRESFASWRGREAFFDLREESARLSDPAATTDDLHVVDILAMAEPGPAYHQPPDLREVVARSRRG